LISVIFIQDKAKQNKILEFAGQKGWLCPRKMLRISLSDFYRKALFSEITMLIISPHFKFYGVLSKVRSPAVWRKTASEARRGHAEAWTPNFVKHRKI
jgi:hypothetical protein